jgi:CubicO group peptidase (beta-lactamase class C family)
MNFSLLHAALRRQVDSGFLPGVASAVLHGRQLVDQHICGLADKEAGTPLGEQHIYRMFSNTKLVTACAALLLWEDGQLDFDDPVERHIPQLAQRQVLQPGATQLTDTEPAHGPILLRHLLSHSSGLSYGLLDPGTLMFNAYNAAKVLHPRFTLAQKMDLLGPLPLKFHPGTDWEYSVGSDVMARVVEVVSGQSFGDFLQARVFTPLGMTDTGFHVPEPQQARLTAYYSGVDMMNPMLPGLLRQDALPYPGAYRQPFPDQSGGGGLVSTLGDTVKLIRALMPLGDSSAAAAPPSGSASVPALLKPHTLALLARNQLPHGVCVQFPMMGRFEGKGHSLGGCVTLKPGPFDPRESGDEIQWGGMGGTHWWINPRHNIAGVLMTQRHMGFWNPYAFEFKMLAYKALGLD